MLAISWDGGGGEVDLSKVPRILDTTTGSLDQRSVRIKADGPGSIVRLDALQVLEDRLAGDTTHDDDYDGGWVYRNESSRLEAFNGGRIQLGDLTSVRGVYIPLNGSGYVLGGILKLGLGSHLTGHGEIATSLVNRATVTIASGAEGLTVLGDYTQAPQGELEVSIDGGVRYGDFSVLRVDGEAELNGTLRVQRPRGYAPNLLTNYPIVTAETVDGQFASVTGGDIDPDPDLTAPYGLSVVALSRDFGRESFVQDTFDNAVAGQSVFFDVQQVGGGRFVGLAVFDPDNNLVFVSNGWQGDPESGDGGPFLLPEAGTHTVRGYVPTRDPRQNPRGYVWNIENVSPTEVWPLVVNQTAAGEIGVAGQTQQWRLEVEASGEVALDVQSIFGAGQRLAFTLLAPGGRTVLRTTATAESPDDADSGIVNLDELGTYSLVVDGLGDDTAAYQFALVGTAADTPHIVSHAVTLGQPDTIDKAWFHFDRAMDTNGDNFVLADDLASFENAAGDLTAIAAEWHDADTLVITFDPLPADELIAMVLGPNIFSADGMLLDQDGDRLPGEMPDDQYAATLYFDETGPRVFLTEPEARASAPLDHITFHFTEAIDANTFTLDDVTAFTGPGGDRLAQLTGLVVGESHATVFFAQQTASGQYTMTIGPDVADAAGNLMDQDEDDTPGQATDAFSMTLDVHSPNLVVDLVDDPVDAAYTDTLDLTWTVRNEGGDPAEGRWWDYVYLSKDDTWDLDDTLVGKAVYNSNTSGAVAANGGEYTGSLSAPMPGILLGDYHVIVRSNLLRGLAESSFSDNQAASANTAHFALPTLKVGVADTGDIDYREALYYQIDVTGDQAGESILLKFGTSDTSVANELYVRKGALPTRRNFDVRSSQDLASNQWLILSPLEPGTYYVMALAAPLQQQVGLLGTYNTHADLFVAGEYVVVDSHFGQGGTAGNRTIEIGGVNFDRTITVSLSDGAGFSDEAVSYYRVGPEELYATFDLTQVAPGVYDVVLMNSAGQEQVVAAGFEVVHATTATEIDVSITAPPAFRRVFHKPWVHFPVTVNWYNEGLNDAPVPIIQFMSSEPFGEDLDAVLAGDGQNVSMFLGTGEDAATPGILMPGQGRSTTYQVVPRSQRAVSGSEHARFFANRLYKDPSASFD